MSLEQHVESQSAILGPLQFGVYQVYNSPMRQIIKHIGVPERRSVADLKAVPSSEGTFRSDRRWPLPTPRGSWKSAAFFFTAGSDDAHSHSVYSSRIAKAAFRGQAGAHIKDPTGMFHIGANGTAANPHSSGAKACAVPILIVWGNLGRGATSCDSVVLVPPSTGRRWIRVVRSMI